MPWQVEVLDSFDQWWSTLSDDEQDSVVAAIGMLLLGGDKTGDARWYDVHVPLSDDAFDRHLAWLKRATPPRPKEK